VFVWVIVCVCVCACVRVCVCARASYSVCLQSCNDALSPSHVPRVCVQIWPFLVKFDFVLASVGGLLYFPKTPLCLPLLCGQKPLRQREARTVLTYFEFSLSSQKTKAPIAKIRAPLDFLDVGFRWFPLIVKFNYSLFTVRNSCLVLERKSPIT
jgi:hypothetical protein